MKCWQISATLWDWVQNRPSGIIAWEGEASLTGSRLGHNLDPVFSPDLPAHSLPADISYLVSMTCNLHCVDISTRTGNDEFSESQ